MTKVNEEICDCCKETIPDDPDVKITGEITFKTGERKTVSYCKGCALSITREATRLGIIDNA